MLEAHTRRGPLQLLPDPDGLIVLIWQPAVIAVTRAQIVVVGCRVERGPDVPAAAGLAGQVRGPGDVADVGRDAEAIRRREAKIKASAVRPLVVARFGALRVQQVAARVVVQRRTAAADGELRLLL